MFDWNPSFSVGIAEIDEQHEKLFNIGKDIHFLLSEYNGRDTFNNISNLIGELSLYTAYHFQTEEKLFETYNYPDTAAHIEEHQKFIDYLHNVDFSEIEKNPTESLKDLLQFIYKWIFKHISYSDFNYREFLKEKMGC